MTPHAFITKWRASALKERSASQVQHPLGNDAPISPTGDAPVLQGVLDGEEHAGRLAVVALVDEDRAPFQQVAVAFERQVEDGVEQRMARADEGRQRLARRRNQRLLEHDPLVAGKHRLADPDRAVTSPKRRRDVRHLVTACLPLPRRTAEPPERLAEERLDVVRLQAARLGPLHLLADALHARGVHRVVNELPFLEQVLQRSAVERLVDGGVEARAHLRLFAVADGVEQQVAQGLPLELQLPEHVEHLAAERLPGLFQLLQQPPVDVAFAGLVGDQIP